MMRTSKEEDWISRAQERPMTPALGYMLDICLLVFFWRLGGWPNPITTTVPSEEDMFSCIFSFGTVRHKTASQRNVRMHFILSSKTAALVTYEHVRVRALTVWFPKNARTPRNDDFALQPSFFPICTCLTFT